MEHTVELPRTEIVTRGLHRVLTTRPEGPEDPGSPSDAVLFEE